MAGAVYEQRFLRPWFQDAWLGWLLATLTTTSEYIVHEADQARRRRVGVRPRKDRALPPWAAVGIERFGPILPELGVAARAAAGVGEVEVFAKDPTVPDEVVADAAAVVFEKKAAKVALSAFYEGVFLVVDGRGEDCTAGRLALLSGAVGLEGYDRIDPVRRRWEDRLASWVESPLAGMAEAEAFRALGPEELDRLAARLSIAE